MESAAVIRFRDRSQGRVQSMLDAAALSERRAAFGELARRYERDLLRVALRLTSRDRDRAEDLVQDALVRGYTAFCSGKYQEVGNAKAWLTRILVNGYLNEYDRRKKWSAPVSVEELTAGDERVPESARLPQAESPQDTLLAATLDEPLEMALESLPDDQRLTVLLVDAEGLEYAEAARLLGVPVGTVRSRLARARFKLQALLRDYAAARGIA